MAYTNNTSEINKSFAKKMSWKNWLPITFNLLLMILLFFTNLRHYITFESIKMNREAIILYKIAHPILTPTIFIAIYITMTALSTPGGSILSILGGFFFGMPFSTIYVVIGATIGATLLFLAARTFFRGFLIKMAYPFITKVEVGFKKNKTRYLLVLRLLPIFPFWVVNLIPAFLNVNLRTYMWTTFVGIIPGSYIYTQAGSGLGVIFDRGESFSVSAVLNPQLIIALVLLSLAALLPIFLKKTKLIEKK